MSTTNHDVITPLNEPARVVLTEESVLRTLDFEIERIGTEQSRPGWTLWALCGALAGIVWLLIEQFTAPTLYLVNTLQLFVAFSALASSRHLLNFLQRFGSTRSPDSPRFRWARDSANRLELIIDIVKGIAIAFIALSVSSGVPGYYSWLAASTYGIIALMAIAVLVFSMFRVPVNFTPQRLSGRAQVIVGVGLWIVCFAILGLIVFGYVSAVTSSPEPVSVADVRAAALVVVGILLLKFLAKDYSSPPLLMSLIQTRRDLAFGRINLNVAIEQAEIAILGMNETTVLQEDLQDILYSFEVINSELKKGELLFERCVAAANDEREFNQALNGLAVELEHALPIVKLAESRLEKQTRALDRRKLFLGNTPTSIAAFSEIKQRITEARNASTERVQAFNQKAESLITVMRKRLKDREDEITRLEAKRDHLQAERDRLKDKLNNLQLQANSDHGPGGQTEQEST